MPRGTGNPAIDAAMHALAATIAAENDAGRAQVFTLGIFVGHGEELLAMPSGCYCPACVDAMVRAVKALSRAAGRRKHATVGDAAPTRAVH